MANYANIKATIDANIYANGNEEITGPILNSVLKQMLDAFIAGGYIYAGKATPTTSPGTPDANVFYIAQGAGTYTNFGGIVISDEDVYALAYNGTWTATSLVEWARVRYHWTSLDLTLLVQNVEPFYIQVSTDTWRTSVNYCMFFIPVVAGLSYRVTANNSTRTRFAILRAFDREPTVGGTVRYATNETLRDVPAGTSVVATAPSNGYFMAVYSLYNGSDATPADISVLTTWDDGVNDNPSHPRFIIPRISVGRRIDARTDSADFGLIGAATNTDWGCTQAFPVRGARSARIFCSAISTSNNYANYTGAVFYAADMTPITTGSWRLSKGTTAQWGWIDLTVPSNAEYLVYEITPGSQAENNRVEIHYLDEEDIYYDNGGTCRTHPYYGERVDLNAPTFGFTLWSYGVIKHQSSARFGDYLVCISDYAANVQIYNLATKASCATLATGLTQKSWWHCNECCFTSKYYDAADDFPLLYVSMQNNGDGRGECVAFRIVPTWTDGEISSFTFTQVQSILLPAMTDDNCLGNPNWAYDDYLDCFWVYSRNNNSSATNYRKATFTQLAIPDVWNGATLITDVDLTDADLGLSFQGSWSMLNTQGGFVKNGRLYIGQGYPSVGYVNIRVVDLYTLRGQISYLDLYGAGFNWEPEGVFEYNGELLTSLNSNTTGYIARIIV